MEPEVVTLSNNANLNKSCEMQIANRFAGFSTFNRKKEKKRW